MVRLASLMRSAIRRRTPMTLISVVSASWTRASPAPIKSLRKMRPPGPEPATAARSIPASRARRRLAGEVMTRPDRAAPAGEGAAVAEGGTAIGAGDAGTPVAAEAGAAAGASARRRGRPDRVGLEHDEG